MAGVLTAAAAAASLWTWVFGAMTGSDAEEEGTGPPHKQVLQPHAPQLVESASEFVDDALDGLNSVDPRINVIQGTRVVVRSDIEEYKTRHVCLISGGGSGHEPAHVGYIGEGMLSAAVAGDVFSSPPTSAVLTAIRTCAGPKGALVIVKNYTGDRLNFGLAVEQAKLEGYSVEMLIVGDDCALPRSKSKAGRRGLAGTVFVHKVLGAMAAAGHDLATLTSIAERLTRGIGTAGVAFTPCHVPGRPPSFHIEPNTCGIGIGIHGEPGAAEVPFKSAATISRDLVDIIFNQEEDRAFMRSPERHQSRYALMVNNLGSTSALEIGVAASFIADHLIEEYGVILPRAYTGTFMTSMDMAGFSITLLNMDCLSGTPLSPLEQWLDAPTAAPGWQGPTINHVRNPADLVRRDLRPIQPKTPAVERQDGSVQPKPVVTYSQEVLRRAIKGACASLCVGESELSKLDDVVGDGDCGSTMAAGARRVLKQLEDDSLALDDPAKLAQQLSVIAQEYMGGTSGALYSIFFAAASSSLGTLGVEGCSLCRLVTISLDAGIQAVMKYGGAAEGDRTMLDVLLPLHRYLERQCDTTSLDLGFIPTLVDDAVQVTAELHATCGRSSYVPDHILRGHPDPGAKAVALLVTGAVKAAHPKSSQQQQQH